MAHHTRHLTVPSAALASAKTRRRRSGGGGGDDGDDSSNGDDGGFFGGGDDGFGSGGNGDGEGSFDGDSLGRWLQDVLLLWSVFCAWSTYKCMEHVTKSKPAAPAFAAVSFSARPDLSIPPVPSS